MSTFNMHVKTIISNEVGKVLLLKENRSDRKKRWDLPGATLTEDESFDEALMSAVQKQVGCYVYPAKIVGITSYTKYGNKYLTVIMESVILNGDLILSDEYEEYKWIEIDDIKKYPLTPWLNRYIKDTKDPFNDIDEIINEIRDKNEIRNDLIKENFLSGFRHKKSDDYNDYDDDDDEDYQPEYEEKQNKKGIKSSFTLLKEAVVRTFNPKKAEVKKTQPKENLFTQTSTVDDEQPMMNYQPPTTSDMGSYSDEITIEHDDEDMGITIDHDDEIIIDESIDDIVINEPQKEVQPEVKVEAQPEVEVKDEIKVQHDHVNKASVIKSHTTKKSSDDHNIKVISKDDKTPRIRKAKESDEKVSFNSESINRRNWKDKLNEINRTDANNQRKQVPHPKGRKR